MSPGTSAIRCPQLDLLRRELIEAYRSLEDDDLFAMAQNPEAPDYKVYLVHEAIVSHRDSCPICSFASVERDPSRFLRQ